MSGRGLLLSILIFFLVCNGLIFFVQTTVHADLNAGFGSYGVFSSKFGDDNSGNKSVFFLGNSVYYGTQLIPEINKLQENKSLKFQTGNFGFTGASVYDYICNYHHLRKYKPDLLLVQFNPVSFGHSLPFYRNDGYKNSLSFSQIRLFKESFFRKSITKDDLGEIICYSSMPLVKRFKEFRTLCYSSSRQIFRLFTNLRLMDFFPNRLNAVGEWFENRRKLKNRESEKPIIDISDFVANSGAKYKQQYSTAEEALQYFINLLKADNQKSVFIIQPSGYLRLPVLDKMDNYLEGDELITFADHHDFYSNELYVDKIHPNLEGAKLAAERHYIIINKILN